MEQLSKDTELNIKYIVDILRAFTKEKKRVIWTNSIYSDESYFCSLRKATIFSSSIPQYPR